MKKIERYEIDYKDLPVEEALLIADRLVAQGAIIFFKYTCENCGRRLMCSVPNTFFKRGRCEHCGHITEIKKCGFVIMGLIQ